MRSYTTLSDPQIIPSPWGLWSVLLNCLLNLTLDSVEAWGPGMSPLLMWNLAAAIQVLQQWSLAWFCDLCHTEISPKKKGGGETKSSQNKNFQLSHDPATHKRAWEESIIEKHSRMGNTDGGGLLDYKERKLLLGHCGSCHSFLK